MFRFDNRLRDNEEIMQLISDTWISSDGNSVLENTAKCRREIIRWSKSQNLNSAKLIHETRVELEAALSAAIPEPTTIGRLTAILEKAYGDEERFWKQRSRVMWLHSGDRRLFPRGNS